MSQPSGIGVEATAMMSDAEMALLRKLCPDGKVSALFKSGSRVDTGLWFRKSKIWVCVMQDGLALLAEGKKPFVQKTAFSLLRQSLYNHVTGELTLAPAGGLALRRFKLDPAEGYQVLDKIYSGEKTQDEDLKNQQEKNK